MANVVTITGGPLGTSITITGVAWGGVIITSPASPTFDSALSTFDNTALTFDLEAA